LSSTQEKSVFEINSCIATNQNANEHDIELLAKNDQICLIREISVKCQEIKRATISEREES